MRPGRVRPLGRGPGRAAARGGWPVPAGAARRVVRALVGELARAGAAGDYRQVARVARLLVAADRASSRATPDDPADADS